MGINWFDLTVLITIILALIKGYTSGLVKQLASLIGLIACAIFSGQVASFISPYIESITDVSDYIIKPLSYLAAFALIMTVFLFLGKLVEGILKAIKINALNKLAGSIFSMAKWLIVISILVNIMDALDKNQKIIKKEIKKNSYSYTYIKVITPYFIPFLGFDFEKKEQIQK